MAIDLTHPLTSAKLSIYPGDPTFSCIPHATIKEDNYSVHTISLGSHTGTHLDAPSHFIEGGRTVEDIPLDMLVGKARVIDLRSIKSPKITSDDLGSTSGHKIVFIRTGWSTHYGTPEYFKDYPFLDGDAASELISRGVEVLGVDTASPDSIDSDTFPVHQTFLGTGRIIVENLNLERLDENDDEINVNLLPLSLAGCDGSPIRAVAWRK